jgi:hypothetical protein
MPYYQVTNNGANYSSTSLTLAAGATTVLNLPSLPADLNPAILTEQLVVVKLGSNVTAPSGGGGGGGSVDVVTDVIASSVAASTSSQELVIEQTSRLPPGVQIINKTPGDIAIRCAASTSPAAFTSGSYDVIIGPEEEAAIAADYLGAVQAICEIASGTIIVRVYQ